MPEPPQNLDARLNVVLVEPEIAWNTGAIGRTCVALGATLWLVRPLGFHIDDRSVKRAGLDYWEHLHYHVVDDVEEAARRIGHDRLWWFSTRASLLYTEAPFRPGDALVFGPESRGLPRKWIEENPERALRIPMRPEARSLNLANAAAVGLYEAYRRIGTGGR